MKATCLATILTLLSWGAVAQQFAEKFRITLPDSLEHARVQWADLDNDGLLDALVIGKSVGGLPFLLTYKMDTVNGLLFKSATRIPMMEPAVVLADEDLDNDIDLVLSGDSAGVVQSTKFSNLGDFSFAPEKIMDEGGAMAIGDLDEDGRNELVVSGIDAGVPFVRIYSKANDQWQLRHDSIQIAASALIIPDLDGDGRNDLFASGRDENNAPRTTALYNRGGLYFRMQDIPNALAGSVNVGDIDQDGDFDLLISGEDIAGDNRALTLMNMEDSIRVSIDTLAGFETVRFFSADLNSNGLADISVLAFAPLDTLNAIIFDDSKHVDISSRGLADQAFGDYDRDGDLDLLQAVHTLPGYELVIYRNGINAVNGYPGSARLPLALTIFNRTFIYWEPAEDDHTPANAITYDLTLQSEMEDRIVGAFDLLEDKRLTVTHGNRGANNFLLLRDAFPAFAYRIQSVDNSFHAGKDGVCVGTGIGSGNGAGCEVMSFDTLSVCKNERLALGNENEASWFSFSHGFLGRFKNFSMVAESSDTLFSVASNRNSDCGAVKVYLIGIQKNFIRKIESEQFVCEGIPVEFGVEPGWDQVVWSSALSGFLSNEDSIVFSTLLRDTLIATVNNSDDCTLQRRIALKISNPEVIMSGEVIHLVKGSSVQLDAGSGGVEYQWVPSGSLSDDRVSNPIASPSITTAYTVTVTDSIGCTSQGQILVIVEQTAFAPNLFTPNGDGKNDAFRVYGLSAVNQFVLTIRNREGSLVYETRDPATAMATGWDGHARGTAQPSGVYFWHVEGQHASGMPLLLNGKNSGTIVLIR